MQGYASYNKVQNITENPRAIEYRLLAEVTAELIAAENDGSDVGRRAAALQWNQKVWSTFRLDLAGDDNLLPSDLKARLISLSLFVDRQTFEALYDRTDLAALIDINKNIMEGLRVTVQEIPLTSSEMPRAQAV